jgi:hypothetical protein
MTPKLVDSRLKGVAGPGGFFKEKHEKCLCPEDLIVEYAEPAFFLKPRSHGQEGLQLFQGPILGSQQVFSFE